jgi:hypothetical protein
VNVAAAVRRRAAVQSGMKRKIIGLMLAVSLGGVVQTAVPETAPAKSCSRGTHAVIGGAHKCLARGQFCARGAERTYHRYGFHCHKQDARGNYHLT